MPGCCLALHRQSNHPARLIPSSNSISLILRWLPFKDSFAGVFRCDNKRREMNLNRGFSSDGFNWNIDNDPISWQSDDPEISQFQYRYDRGLSGL